MRWVAPIFEAVLESCESGELDAPRACPDPNLLVYTGSGCEYSVIWQMICVEGLSSSRRFGSSLSSSVSSSAWKS